MKIIVTPAAEFDMHNIFHYIAQDNTQKAAEIIEIFENKFNMLAFFPKSGFKRPGFIERDVRIFVIAKHYQIIYAIKNDSLYILRVLSGFQDITSIF